MNICRNERGGILSSIFVIPVGIVAIIAIFLLGYSIGRNQGVKTAAEEKPQALPEVGQPAAQEKEEYTFYKTLTEKGDKTLSIELKSKPRPQEPSAAVKEAEPAGKTKPAAADQRVPAKQQAAKAPPRKEIASAKPAAKARFTIQTGSYPDKSMAEDEVRAMKKRGYAAFLVQSEIPDKGTWYRVRVGSFSTRQPAEKLAAELKSKEGISSLITAE